jgi:hypothetical protein
MTKIVTRTFGKDQTVVEQWDDGKIWITSPDRIEEHSPTQDGKETVYTLMRDGVTVQTFLDGSTLKTGPKGETLTTYSDKSSLETWPNGETRHTNADGTSVLRDGKGWIEETTTLTEGNSKLITKFNQDGAVTKTKETLSDGTTIHTDKINGMVTTKSPDGTITEKDRYRGISTYSKPGSSDYLYTVPYALNITYERTWPNRINVKPGDRDTSKGNVEKMEVYRSASGNIYREPKEGRYYHIRSRWQGS